MPAAWPWRVRGPSPGPSDRAAMEAVSGLHLHVGLHWPWGWPGGLAGATVGPLLQDDLWP
eukprot:2597841-Alexandrium_andersonii.AAC.1